MDDELATIASAGAGTLGAAVAKDAWQATWAGIAGAFRLLFRHRRAMDSREAIEAPCPETGSGGSVKGLQGHYTQTNQAMGGEVFAVQRGDMTVHTSAR